MKNIAIFGAGGLGREVLALIRALEGWKVIGFFDDGVRAGTKINEVEVLGGRTALVQWQEELNVVIAIGSAVLKREVGEYLKGSSSLRYPVLIHPRAVIMDSERIEIGEGSIITAGSVLTTNITIGKHVFINLNATVGHDTEVEDYASIMPGVNLAGEVVIGEAALIGSGANVLTGCSVGAGAVIGSGAVVTSNIGDHQTAVGVPAKVIKP